MPCEFPTRAIRAFMVPRLSGNYKVCRSRRTPHAANTLITWRPTTGLVMLHVTTHGGESMARSERPKSSREKVRAYRERLRRQGMRPLQIWVPDVRSPQFELEAQRQALAVANSALEAEDQAFIDAISDPEEP